MVRRKKESFLSSLDSYGGEDFSSKLTLRKTIDLRRKIEDFWRDRRANSLSDRREEKFRGRL